MSDLPRNHKVQPHITLNGYRENVDYVPSRPVALDRTAYARLSPRRRAIYDAERVAWLRAGFRLETPTVVRLGRDVRRRLIGFEAGRRGSDLIILDGPANSGKTSALLAVGKQVEQRVARLYPDYREAGVVPVVHIDMSPKATPRAVAADIVEFFEHPVSGTGESLMSKAIELLNRHNTRLLVVDEFQMLNWQGASGDHAINALKSILNHSNVLPVIGGIDLPLLLKSAAASQLANRGTVHTAYTFNKATDEDWGLLHGFLTNMAPQMLLLDGPPSLTNFADLILGKTGGSIGSIRYLLTALLTGFIDDRDMGDDKPEVVTNVLINGVDLHSLVRTRRRNNAKGNAA